MTVLEKSRIKESWLIFVDQLFQAQEQSILKHRKSSKSGRRPAQISKELLTKFRHQKEAHKRWKKVQVAQEEYRDTDCLAMQGQWSYVVRRIKAHLELNLARGVKSNNKGFYRYSSSKEKIKENVGSRPGDKGHANG